MTPADRVWIDSEGHLETVMTFYDTTQVIRGRGYNRPGSIACEMDDTGNGFIARFPATSSTEQDYYVCLDYDQARNLVLALTPHAKELGFKESKE